MTITMLILLGMGAFVIWFALRVLLNRPRG